MQEKCGLFRSMMPFLIFALHTCDFFNIDMFEILKELSEMIENCLIWRKKAKKIRRFSAGAAVPLPFLHSSILYPFITTAMPNLRAVTIYLVDFLWLLFLVWKSVTSATSLWSHELYVENIRWISHPILTRMLSLVYLNNLQTEGLSFPYEV